MAAGGSRRLAKMEFHWRSSQVVCIRWGGGTQNFIFQRCIFSARCRHKHWFELSVVGPFVDHLCTSVTVTAVFAWLCSVWQRYAVYCIHAHDPLRSVPSSDRDVWRTLCRRSLGTRLPTGRPGCHVGRCQLTASIGGSTGDVSDQVTSRDISFMSVPWHSGWRGRDRLYVICWSQPTSRP